jgi:hypothetical protein
MHGFLLLSFKELWFLKSGPVLFSVDINITIVFQLALRFWQSIIFRRTCSFLFFRCFKGDINYIYEGNESLTVMTIILFLFFLPL